MLSNNEQDGELIFSELEIRLKYKLGVIPKAFTVIKSGIVTFNDCLFRSESENTNNTRLISVYIADVTNNGKLLIEGCSISNIQVEGNVIIHASGTSEVEIKV
jgi:hypothetical protein